MEHEQKTVEFETMEEMMAIFGNLDEHIHLIEKRTGASIVAREGVAEITGTPRQVELAGKVLQSMSKLFHNQEYIDENRISYLLDAAEDEDGEDAVSALSGIVAITHRGKPVKCRTLGQKRYMEAIDKNTVVFAIGPAGTGKTYLAMAKAVVALKNKEVSRIILTRPAVEAGEKLGFLPGDLQNKVDPYLRPLYDALYDFMGADAYQRLSEKGVIEVAPLAYMRGRTLTDAWIILDEGQNITMSQMKMFLTRFGEGSKVVVTGDVTQIDLPEDRQSGLKKTAELLKDIEGIEVVQLTNKDVVRHRLVKDIISAFEKYEKTVQERQPHMPQRKR